MADLAYRLRDAAARGDVEAIRRLIDAGADVNAKNHGGNAALHYAAWAGSAEAVAALLSASADRAATNLYGATALDIAVRDQRDAAADALREP